MLLFPTPALRLPSRAAWLYAQARLALPQDLAEITTWADANYRVMNNDAEYFRTADTPWLLEPLQMADDPLISTLTYVKPVQIGGTSLGEIILMRRILDSHGLIHYNWPTDEKAKDRWTKYTERRLRACRPIHDRFPSEYQDMLIRFPGIVFSMQGVYTGTNLDSDTVDLIINEEVHQWDPGKLAKARGRQTRVDFPKFITISNAGHQADQLHQEFQSGTQQHYENYCPGCKQFHTLRTRWEDNHPELGGLRYDSEGCKRPDGTFDYNKLVPTIRYQMPCGYIMPDDIALRRESSARARYSQPYNTGALLTNRSYTLQAVACHNIRWLDLIQEKHTALRTLKTGDDTAWRVYCQERESLFYDPSSHRPYTGHIITTTGAVKNRTGLPDEAARPFAFDWQQGYKAQGELTHYWGVIESLRQDCSSQVLWAGKVEDENELLTVLKDHHITEENGLADGFIDASKNTKHILSFCYRAGINAVMGNASGKGSWKWPDATWRYYAPKKYIYRELGMPPKYDLLVQRDRTTGHVNLVENPDEPYIIMYNKAGLLKNHFFIREFKANILKHDPQATPDQYIERIIPTDIGEDYLKHHEAWERDHTATGPKQMGEIEGFKKIRRADHLMSCTTYIDLSKDLSGWLGNQLARLGVAVPPANNQQTSP